MTLVVDAGPLVAFSDRRDPLYPTIKSLLEDEPGSLVLPAPVTAEVDYLVGARAGKVARRAFLSDLAAGRFVVPCLEPADYDVLFEVERRYSNLDLSLADISVMIMAARFETRRLLTFDQRDFRTVRPLQGGTFELLPADA